MNEKITFLKNISLFKDFKESDLAFIAENLQSRPFKEGEIIFQEGDDSKYLGFVAEGKLEILKWDEKRQNQFKIDEIGSQETFGELAFLDKATRSATIKAISNGDALILQESVFASADQGIVDLYKRLIANLAQTVVPRLRTTNQSYVRSLKAEIDHLKMRTQFGKFFVQVIIIFGIASIFDSITRSFKLDSKSMLLNWSYLVVLLIPLLISAKHFGFKLQDAGVTLKNWQRSLVHGLCFSVVVVGIYFLVKHQWGHLFAAQQLANLHRAFVPWFAANMVHDYIQELMARGIAQTILQRFLDDAKGVRTVFAIALVFAVLHLHMGYVVAISAYLLSLFLGLVYVRSYNLIGVSIIHITIDTCGFLLGIL